MLGPLLSSAAVAATLAFAPVGNGAHEFGADGLDPDAVEVGLRARIGDDLDRWTIHIEGGEGGRYKLTARGPDGRRERRTVDLHGHTDQDRSRELASTLALIIDAGPQQRGDTKRPRDPATPSTRGFVAAEGHVTLGPPRDLDTEVGLGLAAGVWLLRERLQPRLRVQWGHGTGVGLSVDQLSVGLGLAAGAPLRRLWLGRLWLGGVVMPAFKRTRGQDVRSYLPLTGGGEVCVLAQLRLERLVLGVRTGVETTFPALRASGTDDTIHWGQVRWLLAIEIGIGIPKNSEFHL